MSLVLFILLPINARDGRASSSAVSEAFIDWATVQFTGIPIIFLDQKNSKASAEISDTFGSDSSSSSVAGWTNTFASASVAAGNATGSLNTLHITGKASTFSDLSNWEANALATASRSEYFRADQDGTLTVSANYLLYQKLTTDHPGHSADGEARTSLRLEDSDPNTSSSIDFAKFENGVKDGANLELGETGTLSTSIFLHAGETGFFEALTSDRAHSFDPDLSPAGSAVTPEPVSMLLFFTGGSLLALRTQSEKKKTRLNS